MKNVQRANILDFCKKNLVGLAFLVSIAIPLLMSLWFVVTGAIPFWYDNARDLLSAWENLTNPTLIGPRSGIEGIFYGPYWIWILSIPLIISKDPRGAFLFVGVVPYLILFPILFYSFRFVINKLAILILWVLFIFNIGSSYATNLWNPHMAPLLLLGVVFVLMRQNFNVFVFKKSLWVLLVGILAGLVINFHISIGSGVVLGLFLYFVIQGFVSLKRKKIYSFLKNITVFVIGFVLSLSPFILFEIRNNFRQVAIIVETLTGTGNAAHVSGLSKELIVELFFARGAELAGISVIVFKLILIFLLVWAVFSRFKKMIEFSQAERNLLLILACLTIGIMGVYLGANNPVWSYHFIGVEIIFLLFFGLIITKFNWLKYPALLLALFVFTQGTINFVEIVSRNSISHDTLSTKIEAVEIVVSDAGEKNYSFYAYSPSIYMYEYSYLFRWMTNKNISFDPGESQGENNLIYLAVPPERDDKVKDFINFRSGNGKYSTDNSWNINDDIIILRQTTHE